MFRWFRHSRQVHSPRRPARGRPRLVIEALEQRCLPSAWTTVSAANLGNQDNELRAVAASSATDAWAVGDKAHFGTLAEHWDGKTWGAVATPNLGNGYNILNGVADLAANNVWAVGQAATSNGYVSLIEHWNGSSWTILSSPNVAGGQQNVLNAITAISATDIWAAGYYQDSVSLGFQPLTEHWDGHKWSIVASPALPGSPSLFFGIAASASNDVWAVGRTGRKAGQLIEHWDGLKWSVVSPPPAAYSVLYAVTVVSANDVWAVGESASQTLTEHWDGTKWSIVPSPNGSGGFQSVLLGVAAVSGTNVVAVGFSGGGAPEQTLIEEWNGQSWSIVSSPGPGNLTNGLRGVAALRTGQVWAVGAVSNLKGNQPGPNQSLILTRTAGK